MTAHPVLIQPLKPALVAGMAQKLPVLLRVQAPDAPPAQDRPARRPYHLALVIDRSGSMAGAPLHEALRCARHMIEQLAPDDLAALVVFDDRVDTLVAAAPVGDRSALLAALRRVRTGGSTNLHGGWKAGADALLPNAGAAALARVILLSDGCANVGETTETEVIAACCALAAESGVSTSTYGLGENFNEELMVAMARRSGGNPYYGDSAADLFEPFAAEFDFISNLYARQLRLSLAAPAGVKLTLLNDYRQEERAGVPVIHLPDLAFGAEAWALVELEIPAELALAEGTVLLQAGASAVSPEGEPVAFSDATLVLPPVSPALWDTLLENPLVAARRSELEASRFLDAARAKAEHGDWAAVAAMIQEGRRRFADHPWVIEVLDGLGDLAASMDQARFSKEVVYSSSRMSSRLAAKEEALASLVAEPELPAFLRRKGRQGKASPPPSAPADDSAHDPD